MAVSLWATALVDAQSALNAVGELVLRVRCCASTGHLILGVGRRTVAVSEYGLCASANIVSQCRPLAASAGLMREVKSDFDLLCGSVSPSIGSVVHDGY